LAGSVSGVAEVAASTLQNAGILASVMPADNLIPSVQMPLIIAFSWVQTI